MDYNLMIFESLISVLLEKKYDKTKKEKLEKLF